jgi:hypothetical protein
MSSKDDKSLKKPSEKRVVMAKVVARRWVKKQSTPEHRLTILYGAREIRNLPSLLRSHRDGKLRIGKVGSLPDLGVKEGFDQIVVWSSHYGPLVQLKDWFEERGFETSGVW